MSLEFEALSQSAAVFSDFGQLSRNEVKTRAMCVFIFSAQPGNIWFLFLRGEGYYGSLPESLRGVSVSERMNRYGESVGWSPKGTERWTWTWFGSLLKYSRPNESSWFPTSFPVALSQPSLTQSIILLRVAPCPA